MIDYKAWSKEYSDRANRILKRVDYLREYKNTHTLTPDETYEIDVRIKHLTTVYHEHRLMAKELYERA